MLCREPGAVSHDLQSSRNPEVPGGIRCRIICTVCISIPPLHAVVHLAGYIRVNSAIQIARRFGVRKRDFTGEHLRVRGFFVSAAGLNEAMIRASARNQETGEERYDQRPYPPVSLAGALKRCTNSINSAAGSARE